MNQKTIYEYLYTTKPYRRVGTCNDINSIRCTYNDTQYDNDNNDGHTNNNDNDNKNFQITLCKQSSLYKNTSSIIRDHLYKNGIVKTEFRNKYIYDGINNDTNRIDESDDKLLGEMITDKDLLYRLIKRDIYYAACIEDYDDNNNNDDDPITNKHIKEKKHICDVHLIMIGSDTETIILNKLFVLLQQDFTDTIINSCIRYNSRKHELLKGTYISNGCLYYSVFREVNNNSICHEMGMDKELTFYLYDMEFNRGHKFYVKENKIEVVNSEQQKDYIESDDGDDSNNSSDEKYKTIYELTCNNRDGITIPVTTPDILLLYYKRCTPTKWHRHIVAHLHLQIDYMLQTRYYSRSVDSHKNKRYICYAQSVQICWDKLNIFDTGIMDSCRHLILRGFTLWGISHTLRYEQSKSEYNRNYNKRMVMINMGEYNGNTTAISTTKAAATNTSSASGIKKRTSTTSAILMKKRLKRKCENKHKTPKYKCQKRNCVNDDDEDDDDEEDDINNDVHSHVEKETNDVITKMGSAEHKNGIIFKSVKNKEQSSSLFVQLNHCHFHNLEDIQMTVQKLRVKHVYAMSAKNLPEDSLGYICCKYIGNIGTAGKNMLFVEGVEISYGHEDLISALILDIIAARTDIFYQYNERNIPNDKDVVVVINNIITRYAISYEKLYDIAINNNAADDDDQYRNSKENVSQCNIQYYYEIIKILKNVHKYTEVVFRTYRKCDNDEHYYHFERNQNQKRRTHHDNFLCINIVAGIPFKRFDCLKHFNFDDIYLSRIELEQFYVFIAAAEYMNAIYAGNEEIVVKATNKFLCEQIDKYNKGSPPPCSSLARKVNHKTNYTLTSKSCVAVSAVKSSLPNKYFMLLSQTIHRNLQIYVDPIAFEKDELYRNNRHFNRFDVIKHSFDNMISSSSSSTSPLPSSISSEYFLNTAFGDINGLNVEDAYVLDKNVNLHLWCILSYSLSFEEPNDLLDTDRNSIHVVLSYPKRNMFVSLRNAQGAAIQLFVLLATIYSENEINFPVFKNVYVYKTTSPSSSSSSSIYTYIIYVIISDDALLTVIRDYEQNNRQLHECFILFSIQTESFHKIPPASSSHVRKKATKITKNKNTNITTNNNSSINSSIISKQRRIDLIAVFKCKSFNGIKIVNAFGQKGLASNETDLSVLRTVEGPNNQPGDFINIVANNCSLISRCASGQLLQMLQNFPSTVKNDDIPSSTKGIIGRVPYFITDNTPILSKAPMRFDEMQKNAFAANALSLASGIRNKYNINNIEGRCYPNDCRHVLQLYESIINSSIRMSKCNQPLYTYMDDIDTIVHIYGKYKDKCEKMNKCMKITKRFS